jgi:hypothetical protein
MYFADMQGYIFDSNFAKKGLREILSTKLTLNLEKKFC